MSNTLDERVVSMKFESSGFTEGANAAISVLDKLQSSLKFDGATDGIDTVQKAISNFDTNGIDEALTESSGKFSLFATIATGALERIGARVVDLGISIGQNLVGKLTQAARDGFGEYELQMNSVQTILSNAGDKLKAQGLTTQEEQIERINATLDELNEYADKTIYNFAEMTRNIGTFTAAGVDLDTATKSIQGIANLAAASGSTSQQASTAMYQLSQAISTGALKLQDWNSVVNAGMGGELFQNALKRTARQHGVAVDEMIEKNGSFRESLQEGWITSDILTETLEQLTYAYDEVGDEAYNAGMKKLLDAGYSKEDAEAILELAKNAQEAATKVRTWTQLWDTVGEALGSGWSATWRIIVGDFLEATELFTFLSDRIGAIIEASSNARNTVLEQWAGSGGRTALVDGIKYVTDAIFSIIETVGKAFSDVFGISAEQLYNITVAFAEFAESIVPSEKALQFLYNALYDVFTVIHSVMGVVGNVIRVMFTLAKMAWEVAKPLVYLAGGVFGMVLNGIARLASGIQWISDRIEGLLNGALKPIRFILKNLADLIIGIGSAIASGIGSVFSWIGDSVKAVADKFTFMNKVFGVLRSPVDWLINGLYALNNVLVQLNLGLKDFKVFEQIPGVLTGAFNVINIIVSQINGVFDLIRSATKDNIGDVISELSDRFEAIGDKVELLGAILYNALPGPVKLVVGLLDQLHTAFINLPVIKPFHDFFNGLPMIAAHTAAFVASGDALSEKLDGLFKGFGYLQKRVEVLGHRLFKTLPEPIQKVIRAISDFAKNIGSSVKSIITESRLFKNAKKLISDFFGDWMLDKAVSMGSKFAKALDFFKEKFANFKRYLNSEDFSFGDLFGKISGKISSGLSTLFSGGDTSSMFSGFEGAIGTFTETNQSLGGIFNTLISRIQKSAAKMSPTLSAVFDNILSIIKTGQKNVFDEAGKLNFDGISTNLNLLVDAILGIPDELSTIFGEIADTAKQFFQDFPWPSFEDLGNLGKNAALLGAGVSLIKFGGSLKKLADTVSGFGKGIIDFPKNLGSAFSKFGEGFNKYKEETKAEAILKIAAAIGVLSLSLLLIASIPADDLIRAGKAMAIMASGLAAFMVIFGLLDKFKVVNAQALANLGQAILGIGVGVLALSAACMILAAVPEEDLLKGAGAVLALAAACALFSKGVGGDGKSLLMGSIGMIAFAVALGMMADVVKKLSGFSWDDLGKGLAGFFAIVMTLTIFGKFAAKGIGQMLSAFLKFGAGVVLIAASIGVLAISLVLLAGALALINGRWEVLAVAAGFILGFALACNAVKNASPEKVGAGLISFALGIGILAGALLLLSFANFEGSIAGLVALAGLLALFGAGAALLDPDSLEKTGKAVQTFAIGIGILTASLFVLGMVPWKQLVVGAAVLGALVLAFGLLDHFGTNLGATAGAMLVFSGAILVMAFAFKQLEGISMEDLAGKLIAIGIAFGAFAIAAGLLAPVGAGMLLVAGAFLAFAAGVYLIVAALGQLGEVDFGGIGDMFAGFLTTLGDVGSGIVQSIADGISGAWSFITEAVSNLGHTIVDGIKSFFGGGEGSTGTSEAGEGAVQGVIDGITGKIPELIPKAGEIVSALVGGLTSLPGKFLEVAGNAVSGLGSKIGGAVSSVGGKAKELGSGVINGLGSLAGGMRDKAASGISSLVSGFSSKMGSVKSTSTNVVSNVKSALTPLASSMKSKATEGTNAFVSALSSGGGRAKSSASGLVSSAKSGLSSLYSSFHSTGSSGASGLADGLTSGTWWVKEAARKVAQAAIDAAKETLKSHSPSRVFIELGEFSGEGLAIGFSKQTKNVSDSASSLAGTLIDSFSGSLQAMSVSVDDILDTDLNPVITPVIDGTQFDYDLNSLSNRISSSMLGVDVNAMNYNEMLSGKLDSIINSNDRTAAAVSSTAIDYDRLGLSIANALIQSGVHVEMDGGQLMGYLAGEIRDTRRMYS